MIIKLYYCFIALIAGRIAGVPACVEQSSIIPDNVKFIVLISTIYSNFRNLFKARMSHNYLIIS